MKQPGVLVNEILALQGFIVIGLASFGTATAVLAVTGYWRFRQTHQRRRHRR